MTAVLKKAGRPTPAATLPRGSRRVCWGLAVLDVGAAAWMLALGSWFDETSPLTRVVTLGGHHVVVLWLAIAGVALLLPSAVLTNNFATVRPAAGAVLTAAVGLSVVATGGLVSIVAFVVLAVGLIAVLGRAFVR